MEELNEIIDGMSLEQLETELIFQQRMGENLGGTICSEIAWRINSKRNIN